MVRWNILRLALLLLWLSSVAAAASVTFTYKPPQGLPVTSVSLRGTMNDWGETAMNRQPEGSWSVTVDLVPGTYQYKYFINGQWPKDMCNDPVYGSPEVDAADGCVSDGYDGQNAVRRVTAQAPLETGENTLDFQHDPSDPADLSAAGGKLFVRFAAAKDSVKGASVTAQGVWTPMLRQLWFAGQEMWSAEVPLSTREYRITVTSGAGARTFGPYTVPAHVFTAVPWVAEGVGYQIFPERFDDGDPANDQLALKGDEYNFNPLWQGPKPFVSPTWDAPPSPLLCCHQYYGGDLQGILDKLDYLKSLGVSLLYLNPIFDSSSAHGYDTSDYFKVKPEFGDAALLKKLLDAAHARGIKVLFDFVPNHTGLGFWAFQDVVKNGEKSPYWDWYFIKKWPFTPGDISSYVGWNNVASLPKLNTANPEVQAYLLKVAKHWISFGFDGLRVDAPQELLEPHKFFAKLHAALTALKPDVYIVGEIWQRDPSWLQGDQFDSLGSTAATLRPRVTWASTSSLRTTPRGSLPTWAAATGGRRPPLRRSRGRSWPRRCSTPCQGFP